MSGDGTADAPSGSPIGIEVFLHAIDGLRDDVREDIAQLRREQHLEATEAERRLMGTLATFARAHSTEHDERDLAIETDLAKFRSFMHAAEIAQARRDGALGVFRFVLEQLSRHSRPLLGILGTIIAGLAIVSGSVHVSVGIR